MSIYFSQILGNSPEINQLIRKAAIVSATDVTVLLYGETGTGKELFAQAVQQASRRASRPFMTLNCALFKESLFESELFGHKKGSFTGAVSDKIGIVELMDGGTLFLDEINSTSLEVQGKLLRFLENREYLPLGERKMRYSDVRIISASNANLLDLVEKGQFRSDLYFRLNTIVLEIPSLKQRRDDIALLANTFLQRVANANDLPLTSFSKKALDVLMRYEWPGNIRELKNHCDRLAILLPGKVVKPENLPEELRKNSEPGADSFFELPQAGINLDQIEKELIIQAIERTRNNKTQAAKLLGISRDALSYRLQKYEIAL